MHRANSEHATDQSIAANDQLDIYSSKVHGNSWRAGAALVAWILIVGSVQHWHQNQPADHSGLTPGWVDPGKGVIVAGIFLLSLIIVGPRIKLLLSPTAKILLIYSLVAIAGGLYSPVPSAAALRAIRLAIGILIPALLWRRMAGDPDGFLRLHRYAHIALAASVFAGWLLFGPAAWEGGQSFAAGGRLQGVVPAVAAPGVGEVGAILCGLSAVALAFRQGGRRITTVGVLCGGALILLSHTRTAAAALLLGILAAFSAAWKNRRGRQALIVMTLILGAASLVSQPIREWAQRDQTPEQLSSFTGRRSAWQSILEEKTSVSELIFGHGLGSTRVELTDRGSAIDNGWLSLYWATGLLGLALVAAALLTAIALAVRAPSPYVRAASVYLLVFIAVSSITETGLSDFSPYTLHLIVAAAVAHADRLGWRTRRTLDQNAHPNGARPAFLSERSGRRLARKAGHFS